MEHQFCTKHLYKEQHRTTATKKLYNRQSQINNCIKPKQWTSTTGIYNKILHLVHTLDYNLQILCYSSNQNVEIFGESPQVFRRENKNSALFVFPRHKIILVNLDAFVHKPCFVWIVGCKTQLRPIMCPLWPSFPPITWLMYGKNGTDHHHPHRHQFPLHQKPYEKE